ncbi:MAG: LacI family DNA-binding transcriptional regulator [Mediterraneibacter gnavus]
MNEIAEMVGVSKTTISFYLNGKTNKMSDETQKRSSRSLKRPVTRQALRPEQ